MTTPNPQTAELVIREVEALLAAGNPLPAYDVTRDALELWPEHVRLRQLHALSLLRSGAADSARPILQRLVDEGAVDEETLGLLARVYKDAALEAVTASDRRAGLTRAEELYRRAWERHQSTWTGVNAATCLVLLGRHDEAMSLAPGLKQRAQTLLEDPRQDRYWIQATLGELGLIGGDIKSAGDHYAAAAAIALAGRRYGDLASTRRNSALLIQAAGSSLDINTLIPIQRVIVFSGHRADEPGRPAPRFPAALEGPVAARIRTTIDSTNAVIGYCSGAAGADLIFIETMLACGREVHVLLPFPDTEFIETSIRPSGSRWVDRWRAVRERVASVRVAADAPLARRDLSYEYANRLLHGMARLRARSLESEPIGLAVLDAGAEITPGGTAATVREWAAKGLAYEVIDIGVMRGAAGPPPSEPRSIARTPQDALSAVIAAFVFCDAVGFSKLTDAQMPAFVNGFLRVAADLINQSSVPPLVRNTWGDGMFFVFARPIDAAHFALDLIDGIAAIDRRALDLPGDLTLRVGIHAGPVYQCEDPITMAPNFFGAHVSRAARIEPIAPPGQVFGSEPFAALLAASHDQRVECRYAGSIPLAKKYGTFPMYHVRRATASRAR